jgi:hypothetical protein
METRGTKHLAVNEFIDAVVDAAPGASIVYASGDLALSAQWSQEVIEMRAVARRFHDQGRGQLFQRRRPDLHYTGTGGGCCYEYLFVKALPVSAVKS